MKTISSFSKEGYKLYGRTFLRGMLKHWPGDIEIYIEGKKKDYPGLPSGKRITYKNLFDIPGCFAILQAMGTFPALQGHLDPNHPEKTFYTHNAFRFSRKVFAQCDAATDYDGLLFWIDADTEIDADVPYDWLNAMLEDTFMVYMGRPGWHSCASFVGWNCAHEQSTNFWINYYTMISS